MVQRVLLHHCLELVSLEFGCVFLQEASCYLIHYLFCFFLHSFGFFGLEDLFLPFAAAHNHRTWRSTFLSCAICWVLALRCPGKPGCEVSAHEIGRVFVYDASSMVVLWLGWAEASFGSGLVIKVKC